MRSNFEADLGICVPVCRKKCLSVLCFYDGNHYKTTVYYFAFYGTSRAGQGRPSQNFTTHWKLFYSRLMRVVIHFPHRIKMKPFFITLQIGWHFIPITFENSTWATKDPIKNSFSPLVGRVINWSTWWLLDIKPAFEIRSVSATFDWTDWRSISSCFLKWYVHRSLNTRWKDLARKSYLNHEEKGAWIVLSISELYSNSMTVIG